ncbi:hypothetical protein FBU59_006721 [Linderina macrospora]|uniref:Uncharacterized protein n=1 Tax=Linderina macrospora TaxID=4868 RepID=A0ACC1IZ03_9FUNG|nr:hypothetical protein FBU59_006721 [Linderina macrospora]
MVRQVSENTVLKQTAYLLFYERSATGKDAVPRKHKQTAAAEPKSVAVADEPTSKPKHLHAHKANGGAKVNGNIAVASDDMELELGKSLARASKLEAKKLRKKAKKLEKLREKKKQQVAVAKDPDLKSVSQELAQLAAPDSSAAPAAKQHTQESVTMAISQGIASDEASSEWTVRSKRGPSEEPESPGKRAKTSGPRVTVVDWEEDTASKRAKATMLAEQKSSKWSVKEMRVNRKSQYGADVKSWDGSDATPTEADRKHKGKKMRRPDTWNAEYDRGRVKKVKKGKRKVFTDTINPFQKLGERQSAKK